MKFLKWVVLAVLVFGLAVWFFGANKTFSIKDDTANFSLEDLDLNISIEENQDRNAYFGDLHVHTKYSFDAYLFGTTATPDDAYRYAKGGSIKHPLGYDMQLDDPLDFYAVTDHGAWLGMMEAYSDPDSSVSHFDFAQKMHGMNDPENLNTDSLPFRLSLFGGLITKQLNNS